MNHIIKQQRKPVYVVSLSIEAPREPVFRENFMKGWRLLSRENPHLNVHMPGEYPEIIVAAETEYQLQEFVAHLTYLTEFGCDLGV